jgi:hypothetical protein
MDKCWERRNKMNVKYLFSRFFGFAATCIYKEEIKMKQLLNSCMTFFPAMLLLILTGGGDVMAGGLVDTRVERFQSADFTNSGNITNPWWTLPAGQNYLYFAEDADDCVWNLTEVLSDTTDEFSGIYAGTVARTVLDRGWVDEDCIYGSDPSAFSDVWGNIDPEEVTYDWYAQDSEMNIWYMGEHTFDGVDFAGSFVAGCDGAEAGIVILGNPSKGNFYQQEYYKGKAEDWGKVLNFKETGDLLCMKTKEWTPLEGGAIEHKFYCSDGTVGELSLIEELKGKTVIVELVDRNIDAPPADGLPISPIPSCP